MTAVCGVENCPYRKNVFCGKLTLTLNNAGVCTEVVKASQGRMQFAEQRPQDYYVEEKEKNETTG